MDVKKAYLEYLLSFVTDRRGYSRLFQELFETLFVIVIDIDENRALDGLDLRYRFCELREISYYKLQKELLIGCSMLEMMVALAIRCEETIMGDSYYGDRTSKWFWKMIDSMGLSEEYDDHFDECYVRNQIANCIYRNYKRDGEGGLFHVKNVKKDMRKIEIWYQMLYYLDSIT